MTRRKWTTFSRCSPAAGLTLIEVVAALAIMGTLLVGIVLAKSRHTRQLFDAQRKAEAIKLADGLISQWWSSPTGVPVGQSGGFEDQPDWSWRVRQVGNLDVEQLGLRVARVEVIDELLTPNAPANQPSVWVQIDLALPDPTVDQQMATPPEVIQP